jgi:FixJ family two-component response regulator
MKASFEAGADQHLSKPIRADALIEAIIHAMAEREGRDEEAAA